MKAPLSTILTTHALRIATFTAMLLGLVVTAPLYGQDSERERMNALQKTISASNPAPLEHSERSILAVGTELLSDGGFEGGYYGGTLSSDTSGTTGPWKWYNSPSFLNPIWQNYGSSIARTGNFMVYFNPFGPAQSQIYQRVSIPPGVTATLSFWLKIGSSLGSPSDYLGVNFTDMNGHGLPGFVQNYRDSDAVGFSWVNYSYDVSAFAGQTVNLLFGTNLTGTTIFMLDDVSLIASAVSNASCTEDTYTMCLVNGRYKVTSHWKNQYAGGVVANLSKARLTDKEGAFWIADASTHEYLIRFNTATNNGRVWIAIPTFTDVEFWVAVTDTVNGQYKEYHSSPGNQTLIYDPHTFVYP